jgi:cell division protein DivIC
MKFLQIINYNKFALISLLLLIYLILNLLDGERGLISYYEKKNIKQNLIKEKHYLAEELKSVEKKNRLLTDNIDTDFLETVYRQKFMVGKSNEKIYKNN